MGKGQSGSDKAFKATDKILCLTRTDCRAELTDDNDVFDYKIPGNLTYISRKEKDDIKVRLVIQEENYRKLRDLVPTIVDCVFSINSLMEDPLYKVKLVAIVKDATSRQGVREKKPCIILNETEILATKSPHTFVNHEMSHALFEFLTKYYYDKVIEPLIAIYLKLASKSEGRSQSALTRLDRGGVDRSHPKDNPLEMFGSAFEFPSGQAISALGSSEHQQAFNVLGRIVDDVRKGTFSGTKPKKNCPKYFLEEWSSSQRKAFRALLTAPEEILTTGDRYPDQSRSPLDLALKNENWREWLGKSDPQWRKIPSEAKRMLESGKVSGGRWTIMIDNGVKEKPKSRSLDALMEDALPP